MDGVFLLQDENKLIELNKQPPETEDYLQGLLESFPNLMPGAEINSANPRRWLLVKREAAVPDSDESGGRWSADHLFLDQDAIPTIVEVKRASDTRIRREVVGQMLDYAANAVAYWPLEKIRSYFEITWNSQGEDPDLVMAEFIDDDQDIEQFWLQVKTNLQAGRLRLLFVADRIPTELRRIIEFLNSQMDPAEVLGIEIGQYVGQGLRVLAPKVVGQTVEAQQKKAAGPREYIDWDEKSVLADTELKGGPEAAAVAKRLLDWSREMGAEISWGRGAKDGSFSVRFRVNDYLIRTFAVYSNGSIEIQFQYLATKPPYVAEDIRDNLRRRLNEIPGVNLSVDRLSLRPSFSLKLISDDDLFEQFIKAIKGLVDEIDTF